MVRVGSVPYVRRYAHGTVVRQTVRNGRRVVPTRRKSRVRTVRRVIGNVLNLLKVGLFVGAALCPFTCVFALGWMLLN